MRRDEQGQGRDRTAILEPPGGGAPPPRLLDRYRLLHRLGEGGFAVVWQAWDERLERDVAVKVLPPRETGAPRGGREALAAARLSHPGIVTLFEGAEDDDGRYLVSELVRGRTLATLEAEGTLSDVDVARIGTVLCEALAHAHERGVVHRDVKPSNVMVPERSAAGVAAKLTDFGVAQLAGVEPLTGPGDVVGTLAYMAPEQADGRTVGPPADLYSLALVLYEAFTGEHPVRRAGAAATARRIGSCLPPMASLRGDLPPELCWAIDRALLPRPGERGTLEELRAALAGERVTLAARSQGGAGRERCSTRRAPFRGLGGRVAGRVTAGVGAGGLAWAGLATLGPAPPLPPSLAACAVAVAVGLLPRLAWLAAAGAGVYWLLSSGESSGTAAIVGLALLACPLLLAGAPRAWSAPAVAPLLGAVGLAAAFPALAGQARAWHTRAALGLLGYWWLALTETLTGATLFFGPAPLLGSGILLGALVWAAFAVLLPLLVRGRRAALDVVGASAWGGALGSACQVAGESVALPDPRGAAFGAALGAALAVAARAAQRGTFRSMR